MPLSPRWAPVEPRIGRLSLFAISQYSPFKAMRREPTIDWLLENQEKVVQDFHDLGVKGEL